MTIFINSTGLTVDGLPLNTVAKAVKTKSGRLVTASVRGSNQVVAGRSGSIYTPNKSFDEGRFVLPMWVLGTDDDGGIPSGTRLKEFYKNKELLQRVFTKRYGLLDVEATQPDGTIRQAMCECLSVIDFEMFSQNDGQINVELIIPSVFWEDQNQISVTSAAVTNGATAVFSGNPLNGGTAPSDDAAYIVRATGGTLTNPRLTDLTTGNWVQYSGVLASGSDWMVNAATWQSRTGAALGFSDTGGTNVIGSTTRSGSSRLLTLTPVATTGVTGLVLSATYGTGAVPVVLFQGRRKYHS